MTLGYKAFASPAWGRRNLKRLATYLRPRSEGTSRGDTMSYSTELWKCSEKRQKRNDFFDQLFFLAAVLF